MLERWYSDQVGSWNKEVKVQLNGSRFMDHDDESQQGFPFAHHEPFHDKVKK